MAPRLREAKGWILTEVITYLWVSALYILMLSVNPAIRMVSTKYIDFIYLNSGKKKQMHTRSSIHNSVAKRKPECPYSTPALCDTGAVLFPIKLPPRTKPVAPNRENAYFSCHPGKNWNLRQMNAWFPPSPYPKLFRIAWQLYTLVFRPRQLWIGGGEGVYFCV